jgi:CHAT domain-containing protein/Tfp pilus assembly protein PilF
MNQITLHLICFVLLITQLSVFNFAQTRPEQLNQPLELGKPIERELKGGEVHAYTFKPEAGQFVSIVVEQRGIDVVVVVLAPDGKHLAEVDSPNGSNGPEPLSFVANGSGNYRIEVRPLEKTATGRYAIRIEAIRAATPQEKDRDRVKSFAAALVFSDSEEARAARLARDKELITVELIRELNDYGSRFRNQNKYPSALVVSRFTLLLAEQIDDKTGVSDAIYNIGVVLFRQRDFNQALEYLQKSLDLDEAVGDKAKLVDTISKIAYCYQQQDNLQQALEHFQRSLALDREIGGGRSADLLYSIGVIHWRSGRGTEAIEAFQKSLIQYQETGNKIQEYNILGYIHWLQGNPSTSLEYTRKTLDLAYELGDKTKIAWALNVMSTTSRVLGDLTNSMEYIEKALSISETVDNKDLKMNIFITAGLLHQRLENRMKALEFYQKALILAEESKNNTLTASALEKIGSILFLEGRLEEALENFQKCLTLNEAIGNKAQTFYTMNWIGGFYHKQGNYAQALEYFRKALKLSEKNGSKLQIMNALISIASLDVDKGDFAQALESAERAVALSKEVGERENRPRALYWLGRAHYGLKQFEESGSAFEEAISIIESTRANITGQDSRTTFFATHWGSYEAYIDLSMLMHREQPNKGYDVQAFQMSERARARSLLELLNESRTQINQGVVPELLERERSLQKQLNERAEQQTRLLSGQSTPEQAAAIKKEIDALTFDYKNNQALIRLKSPRYAALTQPQPLKLSEIQKEVLDADTILLEYSLGEKRSHLWAVTEDSIKSYELPPRAEIETTVKRFYALVSDGKLVIDDKSQAAYETEAARLSQILLAPVVAQIRNKRIVVVADGALQYLPFGALPSPNSKENSRRPLIAENEIVSLPSASTLSVLRRQVEGRRAAAKTVAVIADPVFDPADARVKPAAKNNPDRQKPPTPSSKRNLIFENAAFNTGIMRDGIIQRLPFSRREAESILAVVPTGEKMQALDFKANRETALSAEMSQYRIVHFAAHGLLNSEHPELSGIVLSLVNEQGQPVDGFMRLNEIYNLNLNADLVVLSACQTALGKEVRGEGLIGLTRGFMYAGSPRVVASLWKVDDVATAELMRIFYQKMLKEEMRPAAALRAAKIEMRKQKRWSAPFYWAAFEIQGEWR